MEKHFKLGIYNDQHLYMMRFAQREGLFYKPSGAGAGDIGLLVTNDVRRLNQACERLNSMGIKNFDIFNEDI